MTDRRVQGMATIIEKKVLELNKGTGLYLAYILHSA
jgi:hypothetical protein